MKARDKLPSLGETRASLANLELSAYAKFRALVNSGSDTERTTFFSDAIFAIAMTLPAVEIRVPEVPPEELPRTLLEHVPQYFAYVLSFAVTGAYWLTYHRLIKLLRGYDANLQRINLLALLFIALTGFASGALARYGDLSVGVVVYAVIVGGTGLSYTTLWQYAWHRKLVGSEVDANLFSYLRARSLAVAALTFTYRKRPRAVVQAPGGDREAGSGLEGH
ncbi:TMEM175 family protein [Arthrobacter sedimenti]|uniref:TMEM175 family protein n=1 Tax=Arthrobacter sedimenti TaxID=2694931 RepID=A0ABV8WR83_9MICC